MTSKKDLLKLAAAISKQNGEPVEKVLKELQMQIKKKELVPLTTADGDTIYMYSDGHTHDDMEKLRSGKVSVVKNSRGEYSLVVESGEPKQKRKTR